MRYALAKVYVARQDRLIETYGDAVWECACDQLMRNMPFKASDLTAAACISHLAPRTRLDICKVTLANVIAEYKDNPEDCPVKRIANHYILT